MAQSVAELYQLDRTTPATPEAAREFCQRLATQHYENFTIVSWFLPSTLRQHFYNVYAYCRVSDDLADEVEDRDASLQLLEEWRGQLHALYEGEASHPVFVALQETIERFDIPREPFDHLLDAFVQDRHQSTYQTFDDLLGYCRKSADPVGRLVLYLGGYRDETRQRLSDCTCTALQLANFWQDVRRDWVERQRIYLPREDLDRFGVTHDQLADGQCTDAFRALLQFEVERTRELFRRGLPLIDMVAGHIRRDVTLFTAGGWTVLDLIESQAFDTLSQRPALSKQQKAGLMLKLVLGGRMPWR